MNLKIEQEIFALRAVYNIKYGANRLIAKRRWFSFLGIFDIYKNEELVGSIKRHFGIFKANYSIRVEGSHYKFISKTYWKPSYQCISNDGMEIYTIIGHKGLTHSIFRNDDQIGSITKSRLSIGSGDEYNLIADNDSNHLLMVAITLVLDSFLSSNSGSNTINIDLGNFTGELQPFDKNWKPK
jgi:uncharacterized protein YxjI